MGFILPFCSKLVWIIAVSFSAAAVCSVNVREQTVMSDILTFTYLYTLYSRAHERAQVYICDDDFIFNASRESLTGFELKNIWLDYITKINNEFYF